MSKKTSKPPFYVYIPVYKNYVYLKHMLDSVTSKKYDVQFVLVNNGSDYDTNKFCKILQRRKGFTVHHYAKALGVAKVWNICLDLAIEAGHEKIIIANSDLLFHAKCIDTLAEYMDGSPDELVACATDLAKVQEVVQQFPFLSEANMKQFHYSAEGMQRYQEIIDTVQLGVDAPVATDQIIDYACFMVRPRELVEKIGYFDENLLPAYWEDTDMHWRLAAEGYTTKCVINAPMLHIQSRSIVEGGFKNESYLPNGFYFSRKHAVPFKGDQLIKNSIGQVISIRAFSAKEAYQYLQSEPERAVFDCFIFEGDNLELLELRFKALAPAVDWFVIVEAPWDMDGNPKPLTLKENRERFAPYLHKVKRLIVQDAKAASTPQQRQALLTRALANGLRDAKPEDLVMVSSANQIPDMRRVQEFRRMEGVKVLSMSAVPAFLNLVDSEAGALGTRVATLKTIKDDYGGDLADFSIASGFKVPSAGWELQPERENPKELLEQNKLKVVPISLRHFPSLLSQEINPEMLWGTPVIPLKHSGESFIDSTLSL